MDLKIAAAKWSSDVLGSEELPGLAAACLEAGLDSPTIRILAGESRPIMSEVGPMFERLLAELHVQVPSRPEAAVLLARGIAQKIVDGSELPYSGAKKIWLLTLDCEEADIPTTIVGLESEYVDFTDPYNLSYYGAEQCQRVLKEIEARIVEEARKMLE